MLIRSIALASLTLAVQAQATNPVLATTTNKPALIRPSTCGQPLIDPDRDRGLFIWQECNGNIASDRWHILISGGGIAKFTSIKARFTALSANKNLQLKSFEQNDSAILSPSNTQLDVDMRVYKNGVDQLSFRSGENACMLFRSHDVQISLGANKSLHEDENLALSGGGFHCNIDTDLDGLSDVQEVSLGTDAFNSDTDSGGVIDAEELAAGTNPVNFNDDEAARYYCGAPDFDPKKDRGIYLWKDCLSTIDRWSLRIVAGDGPKLNIRARFDASIGISDITPVSFEQNDYLDDNDPRAVRVFMSTWRNGVDGIDFTVNGNACYVVEGVSGLPQFTGTQFGARRVLNMQAEVSLNDGKSCSPILTDSDADGLADLAEFFLGTNPNNPDSDGDRLLDGEEYQKYKTDPLHVNSDRDGLSDWAEVTHVGTDPLKADSDDDGLTDGQERKTYNTDPLQQDTDGGGINDGEEVQRGTDPLDRADD